MQSVCIALGEESQVKWKNIDQSDPTKGKQQDFWEYSKRVLLNNKLIGRIQSYKEDKIKSMNSKSVQKLKTLCVFYLKKGTSRFLKRQDLQCECARRQYLSVDKGLRGDLRRPADRRAQKTATH